AINGSDEDHVAVGCVAERLQSDVEEVVAVREEAWKAVTEFAFGEVSDRGRGSAGRGNFGDRIATAGRKNDCAFSAPRSAARLSPHTADHRRRPAADVDFLELSTGKKPDKTAIRRPERECRAISAEEWLAGERVQRAQPEHRLSF